jgi:hypothetical protein
MPMRKLTARITYLFCIGLVLASLARPVHAGSSRMPTGKQLSPGHRHAAPVERQLGLPKDPLCRDATGKLRPAMTLC